ncbi:MAG: TonB-dependent receptor, partial [Gammaproteobacteria bacterium]|nr:TonB-dependent receptor [Gammaproteobacteria bacterium]
FESNKATSQGGPYFDPPPRTSALIDGLPPEQTGVRQYSGDGGFVDMRAAADAFTKSMGGNGVLGYEELDGVNSFLEFVYDFENDMSLEWLSGTSDYERHYALDNRDGPFLTNLQHRAEDFSQWSTEVRLRSAPDRKIEWEAGAFFQHTELTAFSSSLRANVRQSQRFNDITEEVDFTGIFATVTFNVTDNFSIDIGGRHQDVEKFATVEGYAASWVFAVCPEEPCDPGLTPVSVQFDPVLDGYAGCEGSVEDGRGRDRDVYCLVDPSTVRFLTDVPDGALLYAMPFRETRYVPLAWNAGYAAPVGLTARDYAVRVDRGEGPYGERFTEDGFSPQIALRFRPTENISLYARYAESFKIGGYDTGQSSIPTSVDELTFATEDAEQIELGIKGTAFEGRFSYDADIFELEFPNLQVSVLSPDPEQTSAAGNAGQKVRGFEFNTRFAATENLVIGFAGALMEGEMTRFPGAGCTDAEIGAAISNSDAPCQLFDEDGGRVLPPVDLGDVGDLTAIIDRTNLPAPRTPDWKFILDADYVMPFGNDFEFMVNAKAFFSDGYIVDVEGFEEIVNYETHEDLNVMVGIRNVQAGWSLSAFARNLLEARPTYHPENNPFPEGIISQFLGPQAFTSYGVKFEYMFE